MSSPHATIRPTADSPQLVEQHARDLDAHDPLRHFREQFCIPTVGDVTRDRSLTPDKAAEPCVYLCGNSLGLRPRALREAMLEELDDWGRLGVEGHFHARRPWYPYHEFCRDAAERLVGARAGAQEVVMMNSLTVNLHLMMVSFYRPTPERFRIVIEDTAFPSDSYAVQSQAAFHGLDPAAAIVRLKPRAGEQTLRTDDVESFLLSPEGRSVALVLLGGVNYLTGQLMDMQRITAAGHRAGCVVGWDLAHAAGNAPLQLHDWNADFACWCTYKYLNSGAGAVAGCFVHERHGKMTGRFGESNFLPRFAGWWGNDPATRFKMGPDFFPREGVEAWQLSNPPIMALAPVRLSLEIFDKAGMSALRAKSERLTAYLQGLIDAIPGVTQVVEVITPRDPAARGCQLSLAVKDRPRALHEALSRDGVVSDFREPNVIRIAPTPLYNTFHDCWRFAKILRRHVAGEA